MAAHAPLLTDLRERLIREAADGRRQRLFGHLLAACREVIEQVMMTAPPPQQAATFLGLVAVVVRATGQSVLAKALAPPLARALALPAELARYARPEVAWTVAETHRFRQEVLLPPGLPSGGEPPVEPLLQAAFAAMQSLPPDLLDALLLSSYARPRTKAGLVVLIPPATARNRAAASSDRRPAPGSWPPALAAAVPASAAVVDARAERLWLDEALAEVVAREPEAVAIYQPPEPDEAFAALLPLLASAVPAARLVLLHDAGVAPADGPFAEVIPGPEFGGLHRLADGAPGDPTAWPLACYRHCPTDPDVVVPVAGRDGRALARRLEALSDACPAARLRLAPGLTALQANELAATVRRPNPPRWSLAMDGAALASDPATLHRAGLTAVVLKVGGDGLALPLLSAVAQAFASAGLQLFVRLQTSGLDGEALAELRAARPAAVSFHGDHAAEFEEAWYAG